MIFYLACNIKDKEREHTIVQYIEKNVKTTKNIDNADGVLILGGDGTVLKTLLQCQSSTTPPLYTINYGSVGALLMFGHDNLETVIEQIHLQNSNFLYMTRKRLFLQGFGYFMNEVVLTNKAHGRLSKFAVYVDDELLTMVQGDAAIIATNTGSSAYNLSAGGSYVSIDCDCIVLRIVSPFRSRFTGIILPLAKKVKVCVADNGKCIIDGTQECEQNVIEVYYKENSAKFAYFDNKRSIEKRLFDKNFLQ